MMHGREVTAQLWADPSSHEAGLLWGQLAWKQMHQCRPFLESLHSSVTEPQQIYWQKHYATTSIPSLRKKKRKRKEKRDLMVQHRLAQTQNSSASGAEIPGPAIPHPPKQFINIQLHFIYANINVRRRNRALAVLCEVLA